MAHTQILNKFEDLMPAYYEKMILWFPNGKNSIRIRLSDYREFVFTYNKPDDWLFETLRHFLDRLKADKSKGGK